MHPGAASAITAAALSGRANVSAWAIHNPLTACVLFLLLVMGGLAALPGLRVNAAPDLDLPAVMISVTLPGAAPAELERLVTRRVEDAAASLAGARQIRSTLVEGSATTTVEFRLGTDAALAAAELRERMARIRPELPPGARDPAVTRVDSAGGGAALTYAVQAAPGLSEEQVSWFVEERVAGALMALPGVAQVNRLGGTEREVRVALRPDRLLALGITPGQVTAQLRELNLDLPGGRLAGPAGAGMAVRLLGAAATLEELRVLPLSLPGGGGRTVRLGDIARVTDAVATPRGAALLDGRPVVGFEVLRLPGSSELRLAGEVAAALEALEAANPGTGFRLVASAADQARAGRDAALEALAVGAALTVLVVWLFLRDWRATLVAALAIPVSLAPTFLIMAWLDFALNNVTLLALSLVVGVLVDDAIVEIENICRHLDAAPERGARAAALAGSAEIGLAVVATTAAILAVFVPVAFMPGIAGQYFRQFGLTAVAAVGFSLLAARLLTPLLAAHLLRPRPPQRRPARPGALARLAAAALAWCLRHRLATLVLSAAFLGLSLALLPLVPRDFVRAGDRSQSLLTLELAPGAGLAESIAAAQEATRILRERPEVTAVFARVGDEAAAGAEPRIARLLVTLVPPGRRSLGQQEFEATLRPELAARLPGARLRFGAERQRGGRLRIALAGEDPEALNEAAAELERQLRALPGLVGAARAAAAQERPELQIRPRAAQAAELGVSAAAIGTAARIASLGDVPQNLPRFDLPGRQVPVRVVLEELARGDLDLLRRLPVEARGPGVATAAVTVPLGMVAEIRLGAGPARIERLDRARLIQVEAELTGLPLGEAMRRAAALPALRALPPGVREAELGDREMMRELFGGFAGALAAGLLLVYLVLVLLFGRLLQPLVILLSLPLALGGAVAALLAAGQPMGVSAVIGLLMLAGIVAKNAILLVDHAIQARLRARVDLGCDAAEAVRLRARPILMTTVAMCAGMAHAALGLGADAEFRAPMALVVSGGLVTSTLLSLLVVPAAYVGMARLEDRLTRGFARRSATAEGALEA
jgi:HAE1 family hydrophobic/amphiphilic exporter-1